MHAPPNMRMPVLVTEYIPAARLAVFSTPINAFLSAGCPRDQAVMAAAEVERTGACTAVPATAVALPLAPFVAARFDPDGDELAAVVPLPNGTFGLFLAAPRFADTDADVVAARVADAAQLTGRPWISIQRERIKGFGAAGWHG